MLVTMDMFGNGGVQITPSETYKSTYNVNMSNQSITGLTVGKTYAVVFHNNGNAVPSIVSGADLVDNAVFLSNGAGWSSTTIIDRLFFIKATADTVVMTCTNGMYGVLIVQLD